LEDAIKIMASGRAPIPRLKLIEDGLTQLESSTLNPEGKRRFEEVNQLIDLTIDRLTRRPSAATPRQPVRAAEHPRDVRTSGSPGQVVDFRRLAAHAGPFRLVADPEGRPPGPFWPELGPNNTDAWQIGDSGAIKMTTKELLLWNGPGGNLLLTRKNDFKKCTISVALAVNEGTEAYLALRARLGQDGWRAVTSRIIGQGGKVRVGYGSLDFQASNSEAGSVVKATGKAFRMRFVIDEKGVARVYVGNDQTSIITSDEVAAEENSGAAGLYIKTGKVLVESLMIKEQ
jgi:hypothetical protein